MEISTSMDLNELRDRMGEAATLDDAREMRDLLVAERERGVFENTEDIPDEEWYDLLNLAATPADQ